jgi:glycerol kinase
MEEGSGVKLSALKVDGGACKNNFLMQFQSDIIGAKVQRPECVETTAMGASYLAGLAVGFWSSKQDVIKNWALDREFEPNMDAATREAELKQWKKAVSKTLGWAKD